MEWNDETIARLRALWAEGLSTAEIGRRMNVSKNAVVGKAHRLNLPARPSPIRRDGAAGGMPRPPVPRRVTGPTLPPLSADAPVIVEAQRAVAPPKVAAGAPAAPAAAARSAPVRPVQPRFGRAAACCWPIGEPGTKSFRFCDAEAAAGKPYCAEHAQVAYVKVRDRREEAA
ncbi:GcrA family cell cycle regulator [Limobrevibacterium gyesilva]|uniref:GcrA family cell cycle regulator n=1 Tax=Limobrevibacterium gyesilva TaxID=2991712 RepID=A0AA41YJF0_9PROT|nr:GcrA family cell cycle regulator [Limobrevibacterium gyesilva]MCW3473366.1 GcrA family cell cycle regulator [Limobrevibacterium gyesilva]